MKKQLLFIAALLALTAFSCGNEDTAAETTTTAAESVSQTEPAVTETVIEGIPDDFDFGGDSLRVWFSTDYSLAAESHLTATEYNGEILNDVMFDIYMKTEDYLNISVEPAPISGEETLNFMKNAIMSGDDAFELVNYNVSWSNVASLISTGGLYNFLEMPHVKPFSAYYISEVNEMMVVNDQLYFIVSAWPTVRIPTYMVFNKNMMNNLDLEYPYQLALDGTWTFDVFLDYIKGVTTDLDGDGDFDINDQYGYANMGELTNLLVYGMGIEPFVMRDVGYYVPNFMNDKLVSAMTKAIDLREQDDVYNADLYTSGSGSEHSITNDAGLHVFMLGNSLFSTTGTGSLNLRAIDTFDFGIVPYPKYDKAQDFYCGSQSPSPYAAPVTLSNPEMVGAAMETLSQLSYNSFSSAYIDIYTNEKVLRDEESVTMMKLIMNSRILPEMGYYYQYDSDALLLAGMNKIPNSGQIISSLTKIQDRAEKRAEKFFEQNFN